MKSRTRLKFALVSAITLGLALALSLILWQMRENKQIVAQTHSPTTAPSPTAISLKGWNVYVCADQPDQRASINKLVTQNGGHLQTQMSVDIDYVVIATADTAASAPIADQAKAMHIPILNPARLQH